MSHLKHEGTILSSYIDSFYCYIFHIQDDLYSSRNIIRVVKLEGMRYEEQLALMGEVRSAYEILVTN
jgi:hypothetical protein